MRLGYIAYCFVIILMSSCTGYVSKKNTLVTAKDTLRYIYNTTKQRANDCGNNPDSACTVAILKYPVFNNSPALNDRVKENLVHLLWQDTGFAKNNDLQKFAIDFIDFYEHHKRKNSTVLFSLESSAKVLRQDSNLTTIYLSGSLYDGTGHGHDKFAFINWDHTASKTIELYDIFIPGFHEQLTGIAEKIFRKQEDLSDTSSLTNYFFNNGKFALSNNFLITQAGITFLYNEYEVKPYTEGSTQIDIPYSQIKLLLKPHTVVAQYLK